MNRFEQIQAINERLEGKLPPFDEPSEISIMFIAYILGNLSRRGLIEAPYAITTMGKDVIAICEEFGWEIMDDEIQSFCDELVPSEKVEAFVYLIKASRDGKIDKEANE